MDERRWWGLGSKVAPPRFVLFVAVLAAGLPVLIALLGRERGIMAAFDVAALVFLVAVSTLFGHGDAARMRAAARDNDAYRATLLGFTATTTLVILVAVAGELQGRHDAWSLALVVATLVLAWLFSNTVWALHYAHVFYLADGEGKDAGGLDFPGCRTPDYWDFLYFSLTLGMTFQTSDVTITARGLRRVVLGHSLAAFVFNLGVLAFTVNVIGGG
ncbi:DUF1345 domain-containing protein [Sphingomonas rubra]|uniref:Uncharacterized membrane protein n=1 Tax=Sphingomonas rubra TaxID=634430 RepID=A0A1I5R5Y2_9SPHN|nr:DUF1345 domain-containing protein [Sphingomonas rubra]SFP53855.1 Uncharacterized membrane protein [Sphingomonas rubra]